MRSFLGLFVFFQLSAFAGIQKINIQNLDLEYAAPYGKGTLDKFGVGTSLAPEKLDVELLLTENALDVTSPMVDFTWNDPDKFVYALEKVSAKRTTAVLGTKEVHVVESEHLVMAMKGQGPYEAQLLKGQCDGDAVGSFKMRLLEDCRNKMDLTIKKLEIPEKSPLNLLVEDLPVSVIEEEMPADNIVVSVREGELYLQAYIKMWMTAGLRVYGNFSYENDHKVIAVKVSQIKFGYLPVTRLVMKKLQELNLEAIRVDPPWIRITIEK